MSSMRRFIAKWLLFSAVLVTAGHAQPLTPPVAGPIPTPIPIPIPFPVCLFFPEWYDYRHDVDRTGVQRCASKLSDPTRVGTLAVKWSFPPTGHPAVGGFKASPIVVNDMVFVGSMDGYFYALDAVTGKLKWQYPNLPSGPLTVNYPGIQSSASYWNNGTEGAVIFGAQDPSLAPAGSARLFALNAKTGALIWKSDRLAVINGTGCNTAQLHQSIKYSSPLIFNNKAYVGIHNFGDNPIQVGRVVAVDLTTGHIDPAFNFRSVGTPASPPGTRGGGVWNSPASDGTGVYFTTGNTRGDCGGVQPQPTPNHGLSMIRVNENTGNLIWAWQPVPYSQDNDPDWSAGATVMSTSCGELIASVQKDGWSYAVNAGNGSMRWQFPPTGFGAVFVGAPHNDDHYKRPGAAWNDVLVIPTGGESLVHDTVTAGYGKLHALNACATTEQTRVRWIADVPHNSGGGYSLGSPTVTGGIVFIGTDQGHLVVLADPSIAPAVGSRCSNIDYTVGLACLFAGYAIVPIPKVLADVPMPDGGNIAGLRDEPALAKGRAFVATGNGHVYMLEP